MPAALFKITERKFKERRVLSRQTKQEPVPRTEQQKKGRWMSRAARILHTNLISLSQLQQYSYYALAPASLFESTNEQPSVNGLTNPTAIMSYNSDYSTVCRFDREQLHHSSLGGGCGRTQYYLYESGVRVHALHPHLRRHI